MTDLKQGLTHDLWALRLQQVVQRVSYDSETETEAAASQVFSSQSERDSSPHSTGTRRSKHSSHADASRRGSAPNLLDATALSYIAILLLREPVTVADLFSWMRDGLLLYHRAVQEIPLAMRERLPGTYQELLEPSTVIRPRKMQKTVQSLLHQFSSTFGMAFPPINHPLVLYRWTRELMLPIECFAGTKRLARLLSTSFSVTRSSPPEKNVALRYPEVRLMVLLVITTKLLFPFDDIQRYPSSASDLSALRIDWTTWSTTLHLQGAREPRTDFAANLNTASSEIPTMGDERLDDYLDWYESNIASEDIRAHVNSKGTRDDSDFRRTMFELFPASRSDIRSGEGKAGAEDGSTHDGHTSEALRAVQAGLKSKPIVPIASFSSRQEARDVNRAGSFYKHYRRAEDLPGAHDAMPVKLFHEIAADKAGIELADLVRAVFVMERRLEKVEKALGRRSGNTTTTTHPEDGMDVGSEHSDYD
nr:rna polymerase i-specific transcription initiation factor rrn7 [Quercus suber]